MEKIKQRLVGNVVSNKMDKTVVVEVTRLTQHPKYRKYIKRSKKYKAHDAENAYNIGDRVVIESIRPMSKDKKWMVVERVASATVEAIDEEDAS
ncbi:MAG: 30S ribosomal protein S17 [Patescibacteria group bacterium]